MMGHEKEEVNKGEKHKMEGAVREENGKIENERRRDQEYNKWE
jgi:hypothetical protein